MGEQDAAGQQGAFSLACAEARPGETRGGPFLFCRAARERTSPVSPGACARALLLLPGASPSRLFRSRRSAADRQDDGKGDRAAGGVDGHVRGLVLVFDCVIRPYPGRWTTHFVISDPSDLDAEMYGWIDQAYEFANQK